MKAPRLYFIDAVKAFAIIMMLQGHFISSLMAPEFHKSDSLAYSIWTYFRGITAPTFFTISGVLFTLLLVKSQENNNTNKRIRKGVIRAVLLICTGYILRIPVLSWFVFNFNVCKQFLLVDVLHCIGLSLLALILLFLLLGRRANLYGIALFVLGITVFITEPIIRTGDYTTLPIGIANYLTTKNGSIFTILPWLGFVLLGGSMGVLLYKYQNNKHLKIGFILIALLLGTLLMKYSGIVLMRLYKYSDFELLKEVAYYNYLLPRFGNVLILLGIFYTLENYLKYPIILKTGQKTLSIYIIHFMVIYGSFTGLGLFQFYKKSLTPTQAIIGALCFIVITCTLSFNYSKTNHFLYQKVRKGVKHIRGKYNL